MSPFRFRISVFIVMLLTAYPFAAFSVIAQEPGLLTKALDAVKDNLAVDPDSSNDPLRQMQSDAMRERSADWGFWGNLPNKYSSWTNHSNRVVPLYTFGVTLDSLRAEGSLYSDPARLEDAFGSVPANTVNPTAIYHDQIDVYHLQRLATQNGKKYIITMIFDGMDWQTTRAAAIYRNQADRYDSGRGQGLAFQDYRGATSDFAYLVTTPTAGGAKYDINAQTVFSSGQKVDGGFDAELAGPMPWHESPRSAYPIGRDREQPHEVTDSASSATSLLSGVKTYNGSINMLPDGTHAIPIARKLQDEGYRVGVVTSVPVSHATPAAAYANNVTRKDYQDIARDMVGLPSSSHRREPLPGLDVLIGGGWGEGSGKDATQGDNFMPGNTYFHESDMEAIKRGEDYVVAERTAGRDGNDVLSAAARTAIESNKRLLGYFGTQGGHLPFQTADGDYRPTFDVKGTERYNNADIAENPTLADMTAAALDVLSSTKSETTEPSGNPFWLLIECGDVDWANHANNIDNSIGAVFSGEAAFQTVVDWVEANDAWGDTAVFVTSDHGHYLHLQQPQAIADAASRSKTNKTSE
ncbi:alkaline phosphatase [Neorhodopirellula pilleata]|uniref:Alkaline phosphatase 4 n=1 Tax=Neorhodopirellula pilleata TaxID=2714738 RepID=A0A5C6AQF5_9BACT|nr:alkaline phosphatase [Neorhodopirellula pilleata]TWU01459.1 Alkaline phosphatase 4 precursor [Neorhodopirellula pilleata]